MIWDVKLSRCDLLHRDRDNRTGVCFFDRASITHRTYVCQEWEWNCIGSIL